jgi:hypothetical protein
MHARLSGIAALNSCMTTFAPFHAIRLKREAESAIPSGFPDNAFRERLQYVVQLPGLTIEVLGQERCGRVLHTCLRAAETIAPRNFFSEPLYRDHQRYGHEFRFASKLDAARFALCHEAAMRGEPSPLLKWKHQL